MLVKGPTTGMLGSEGSEPCRGHVKLTLLNALLLLLLRAPCGARLLVPPWLMQPVSSSSDGTVSSGNSCKQQHMPARVIAQHLWCWG